MSDVRNAVRERYGKIAEANGASCCTTDCGSAEPGETVVDLGSGAGIDCFVAARQVGDTGRVIGVDMTPEMVSRARERSLGLIEV